jgi:endonuclease/exonuclease/phosphatase family metal-dependent hydrolase
MGSVNLAASSLRLLTFNIRFGSGCDKIHIPGYDLQSSLKNLYAIAAAIDSIKPDVVALQEVRGAAQAEKIAGKLGMHYAYVSHHLGYRLYFFEWGLAFLFRFKMLATDHRSVLLDDETRVGRVALMGTMDIGGRPVTFINLHFDHKEIAAQMNKVVQWTGDQRFPMVIMGDLNCEPDDPKLIPLKKQMHDTCRMASSARSREAEVRGTLPANQRRVDYIWVAKDYFRISDAGLIPSPFQRISDHIGYFADVELM